MPVRTRMTWTLTIAAGLGLGISGEVSAQAVAKKAAAKAAVAPAAPVQSPAPVDPAAARAQAIATKKANDAEMAKLLEEWETQSRKVQSLQVEFDRFDKSAMFGTMAYHGKALLKSPDLACLENVKCKLDEKGKPKMGVDPATKKVWMDLEKEPSQRIVCTGTEVLQFEWDTKVIYVYPLNKDIRQKALQEGPLPFLFNMKAADVKRRYAMSLKTTTPDYYLIDITPLEEIDKASFERAFLWLRKKDFQPHQLILAKVQNEVSTYDFTIINPNREIADSWFHPNRNIDKWQVKVNPEGAQPAQAAVPGPVVPGSARRAPVDQGARPATGRPR